MAAAAGTVITDLAVEDVALDAVADHIDGDGTAHPGAIARHAQRAGEADHRLGGFGRHVDPAGITQIGGLADAGLDLGAAHIDGDGRAHAGLAVRDRARTGDRDQHAGIARGDGHVARLDLAGGVAQAGDVVVERHADGGRTGHGHALLPLGAGQAGGHGDRHAGAPRRQRQVAGHDQAAHGRHLGARLAAQQVHAVGAGNADVGLGGVGLGKRRGARQRQGMGVVQRIDLGVAANGDRQAGRIDISLDGVVDDIDGRGAGNRQSGLGLRLLGRAARPAVLRQRRGRVAGRFQLVGDIGLVGGIDRRGIRARLGLALIGRPLDGQHIAARAAAGRPAARRGGAGAGARPRDGAGHARPGHRQVADKAPVLAQQVQRAGRETAAGHRRRAAIEQLADHGPGVAIDIVDGHAQAHAHGLGAGHRTGHRADPGRVIGADGGLARGVDPRARPHLGDGRGVAHIDQHHAIGGHCLGLAARGAHRDGDHLVIGRDRQVAGIDDGGIAHDGARVMGAGVDVDRHPDGRTLARAAAIVKTVDARRQKTLGQLFAIGDIALPGRLARFRGHLFIAPDGDIGQEHIAHQVQVLLGVDGLDGHRAGRRAAGPGVDAAADAGQGLGALHLHRESAGQGQLLALGIGAGPAAEAVGNAARTAQRGLQVVEKLRRRRAGHLGLGRRAIGLAPGRLDAVEGLVQIGQPQAQRIDLVQRPGGDIDVPALGGDAGARRHVHLGAHTVDGDGHGRSRAEVRAIRSHVARDLVGGDVVLLLEECLAIGDGLVIHGRHHLVLHRIAGQRLDRHIAAMGGDHRAAAQGDLGADVVDAHADGRPDLELGGRAVLLFLDVLLVLFLFRLRVIALDLGDLVLELAVLAELRERREESLGVLPDNAAALRHAPHHGAGHLAPDQALGLDDRLVDIVLARGLASAQVGLDDHLAALVQGLCLHDDLVGAVGHRGVARAAGHQLAIDHRLGGDVIDGQAQRRAHLGVAGLIAARLPGRVDRAVIRLHRLGVIAFGHGARGRDLDIHLVLGDGLHRHVATHAAQRYRAGRRRRGVDVRHQLGRAADGDRGVAVDDAYPHADDARDQADRRGQQGNRHLAVDLGDHRDVARGIDLAVDRDLRIVLQHPHGHAHDLGDQRAQLHHGLALGLDRHIAGRENGRAIVDLDARAVLHTRPGHFGRRAVQEGHQGVVGAVHAAAQLGAQARIGLRVLDQGVQVILRAVELGADGHAGAIGLGGPQRGIGDRDAGAQIEDLPIGAAPGAIALGEHLDGPRGQHDVGAGGRADLDVLRLQAQQVRGIERDALLDLQRAGADGHVRARRRHIHVDDRVFAQIQDFFEILGIGAEIDPEQIARRAHQRGQHGRARYR